MRFTAYALGALVYLASIPLNAFLRLARWVEKEEC